MKLVAGNSNRPLAEAIAAHLNLPLAKAQVRRFADMEALKSRYPQLLGIGLDEATALVIHGDVLEVIGPNGALTGPDFGFPDNEFVAP